VVRCIRRERAEHPLPAGPCWPVWILRRRAVEWWFFAEWSASCECDNKHAAGSESCLPDGDGQRVVQESVREPFRVFQRVSLEHHCSWKHKHNKH